MVKPPSVLTTKNPRKCSQQPGCSRPPNYPSFCCAHAQLGSKLSCAAFHPPQSSQSIWTHISTL